MGPAAALSVLAVQRAQPAPHDDPALQRRRVGEHGQDRDHDREAVRQQSDAQQHDALLAAEEALPRGHALRVPPRPHVAHGDAPEEGGVGEARLHSLPPFREVPDAGRQHERLAHAVHDGVEHGPEGRGPARGPRHRAVHEIERAGGEEDRARRQQAPVRDQPGRRRAPPRARQRDHVGRHAERPHAPSDGLARPRGDAFRQEAQPRTPAAHARAGSRSGSGLRAAATCRRS